MKPLSVLVVLSAVGVLGCPIYFDWGHHGRGGTHTSFCATDADCGAGEYCDVASGACIVGVCPACPGGGCGCATDVDCGAGLLCVDSTCRASTEVCTFSYECAGGACANSACHARCSATAACPAGQICDASGLCQNDPIGAGQCGVDADCATGGVCIDTTCHAGCTSDANCGAGEFCQTGACVADFRPHPQCSVDIDCAAGHVCASGVCRTRCAIQADCDAHEFGLTCRADGFCYTGLELSPQCTRQTDCASGQSCIDAICR